MPLKTKGEVKNPHIPEDYYVAQLKDITFYERDNGEAKGLILNLDVEYEEMDEVVLPFFAPAKLSLSSKRQSSRLAENLENIGRLELVLDEFGIRDEIESESMKWVASTESEVEELESVLEGVFAGKSVRVLVEDKSGGDSSQVSKLQKMFDE